MSPSLRRGVGALIIAAIPLGVTACTADQFVGDDGGSDGSPRDGEATDGPTVQDASILDVFVVDACVYDGGTLSSCGPNPSCFAGTNYCNVGSCTPLPSACICDHSCTCVEMSQPNPCSGTDGGRQCSVQDGYVVIWCG